MYLQALEFMQHAFEAYTDKSYCVVTLPHDSEEPALMANMSRLAPMPGATFPEVRGQCRLHLAIAGNSRLKLVNNACQFEQSCSHSYCASAPRYQTHDSCCTSCG